jgi:hypothetical protein
MAYTCCHYAFQLFNLNTEKKNIYGLMKVQGGSSRPGQTVTCLHTNRPGHI